MKVVVWDGCAVIGEHEYEGDGPDIHLDPRNLPEQLSVRRTYSGGTQAHMIVNFAEPEPYPPSINETVREHGFCGHYDPESLGMVYTRACCMLLAGHEGDEHQNGDRVWTTVLTEAEREAPVRRGGKLEAP